MRGQVLLLAFLMGVLPLRLLLADSLKQEVEEMKRIQESNSKVIAETGQDLVTLREEVQEVKGGLEETRHSLKGDLEKNEKFLRDIDLRISAIEERLSLHQRQWEEFLAPKPTARETPKKGSPKEAPILSEEAEYKKALAELNLNQYKEAAALLDQFIHKHPSSTLADNAQYWKAEALYALRDFPQALLEFQKVTEKYPKSEKISGAMLKQGYCLFEQAAYEDAKAFLSLLIRKYPNSDEATDAKTRIKKIEGLTIPPSSPSR